MNFWDKTTTLTRILIGAFVFALIIGGVYLAGGDKFLKQIAPSAQTSNTTNYDDLSEDEQENVLRVGINTWAGYSGLAYANGGFKPNKESIFYKNHGLLVELVYIDLFGESRAAWNSDKIDVCWGTLDAFPTEVSGLKESEPRAFVQVDWSRGGDVIVARRNITSMNDLRGKKVAFAPSTPSHSMLLNALKAANMTQKDIIAVEMADAIESAKAFMAGECDAAVTWSPNDQECIANVKGAHVVISTQTLTNAIADVFYAKQRVINEKPELLQKFVNGLLEGNAAVSTDKAAREKAKDYLAEGYQMSRGFFDSTINKAHLCTYGDNLNFFGLNTAFSGVAGDDLYEKMAREFAKVGAAPKSIPSAREILYPTFIQKVPQEIANASNQKEEGAAKFVAATKEEITQTAFSNKRVTINFPSGSSELTPDAKNTIDNELVDIAKSFGSAKIRVVGNTDSKGSDAVNVPLSKARAKAVADYIASEYGFDKNRFIVIGNGSKSPVASNDTETGREANRRTDFELIVNEASN